MTQEEINEYKQKGIDKRHWMSAHIMKLCSMDIPWTDDMMPMLVAQYAEMEAFIKKINAEQNSFLQAVKDHEGETVKNTASGIQKNLIDPEGGFLKALKVHQEAERKKDVNDLISPEGKFFTALKLYSDQQRKADSGQQKKDLYDPLVTKVGEFSNHTKAINDLSKRINDALAATKTNTFFKYLSWSFVLTALLIAFLFAADYMFTRIFSLTHVESLVYFGFGFAVMVSIFLMIARNAKTSEVPTVRFWQLAFLGYFFITVIFYIMDYKQDSEKSKMFEDYSGYMKTMKTSSGTSVHDEYIKDHSVPEDTTRLKSVN